LRQARAHAASTSGVTATTLKIGNTMPYSSPASAYSSVRKADSASFKWVNDQGGSAAERRRSSWNPQAATDAGDKVAASLVR
jgi:hypothetical protein